MPVFVTKETCIGCGACVGVCPTSALSLDADGKAVCEESICIDCLACIGVCPTSAIAQK